MKLSSPSLLLLLLPLLGCGTETTVRGESVGTVVFAPLSVTAGDAHCTGETVARAVLEITDTQQAQSFTLTPVDEVITFAASYEVNPEFGVVVTLELRNALENVLFAGGTTVNIRPGESANARFLLMPNYKYCDG